MIYYFYYILDYSCSWNLEILYLIDTIDETSNCSNKLTMQLKRELINVIFLYYTSNPHLNAQLLQQVDRGHN